MKVVSVDVTVPSRRLSRFVIVPVVCEVHAGESPREAARREFMRILESNSASTDAFSPMFDWKRANIYDLRKGTCEPVDTKGES